METFKIEVKETLSKIIEIKASSIDEAISAVESLYDKQRIVLGSEHHISTDIDLLSFNSDENNIDFLDYVLKNAEEMFTNLSLEELSKLAFGSCSNAISNFKKTLRI